ncbi:MAG: hypothetical protein JXA89_09540 [Anaerolineae bacterium]|nr:hypothetical protein [Anaerolineae bacterium]
MKLHKVISIVDGVAVSATTDMDMDIRCGLSADLMSDVLRFGQAGMLLLTGLTNPQAIRTADMLGIPALLFVRAKLPAQETIALAQELGISLLVTRFTMYEASGLLFQAGLAGIGPCGELTQAPR